MTQPEQQRRFAQPGSRVPAVPPAEPGYGALVLDRLARQVCRTAGVEWSCIFVRDRKDPRAVIAAAGQGVPWELLHLETTSLGELEFAARLHDVGKIRVPDAVLHKPGPLDHTEYDVIRCHAAWGAETLATIPGLQAVAAVVRFHHERWDGTGYPDGLRGARIPLASRIICVCDAYAAMTADRPYRLAMVRGEALSEVVEGSGSQFDPMVVSALTQAVEAAV